MEALETIQWNVLEHEHKEKHSDWYIAFAIAVISASAAAFLLGNILFGIFIIIAGFTLAMYSVKKPEIIGVQINSKGILVNNNLYRYKELKSFWVEDDVYIKEPKLLLLSDKLLVPYIAIPLGDADGEEIEDFLHNYLEEAEYKEPIPHKVMDYLGF